MTLQGHPRSFILAPIESVHGSSYWSLIVTLVLSHSVFSELLELLYAESHIFRTPPLFRPKFRSVPLGADPRCWELQRVNIPG